MFSRASEEYRGLYSNWGHRMPPLGFGFRVWGLGFGV